jgi:hypothetical protein
MFVGHAPRHGAQFVWVTSRFYDFAWRGVDNKRSELPGSPYPFRSIYQQASLLDLRGMKLHRSWSFPGDMADAPRQLDRGGAHAYSDHPTVSRGRFIRLLKTRSKDGSLLSVRIPVTRANRGLLRALRAAELAAWEAADVPPSRAPLS